MKKLFILILVSFITTISVAQSRYRGFVNPLKDCAHYRCALLDRWL